MVDCYVVKFTSCISSLIGRRFDFRVRAPNFANRLLSGSIDELLTLEKQLSVAFDKTPT
jgi:hypothetical protein